MVSNHANDGLDGDDLVADVGDDDGCRGDVVDGDCEDSDYVTVMMLMMLMVVMERLVMMTMMMISRMIIAMTIVGSEKLKLRIRTKMEEEAGFGRAGGVRGQVAQPEAIM